MAQDHLKMPSISEDEASPEKESHYSVTQDPYINTTDAGTVVFLHPPRGYLSWSLSRALLTCKLWLLELFDPALDEGCKEKRVEMLMAANKSSARVLQKQYSEKKLWYLEVIAVHPALQSRGLGGGVMRWIMENVGDQPIYLECTARGNVPFYEAFGFRVVEEVELIDDDDIEKLVYWVMVRA
ncbi:Acyl-CoA N-acyltransferase [Penicillium sp. IBT 18751x]|nr:Acyl-CoA N-acyltransferase [Penicillium sp. IBT 18751x]